MACGIEKTKGVRLIADPATQSERRQFNCCEDLHHCHCVVIEDRRDVFRRELVGCVANQKACLADRTVADYDTSAPRMVRNARFQSFHAVANKPLKTTVMPLQRIVGRRTL